MRIPKFCNIFRNFFYTTYATGDVILQYSTIFMRVPSLLDKIKLYPKTFLHVEDKKETPALQHHFLLNAFDDILSFLLRFRNILVKRKRLLKHFLNSAYILLGDQLGTMFALLQCDI
jgi:hypothetical protein